MKKHLTILMGFLLLATIAAQAQAFEKGSKVIAAGVGIGSSLGSSAYSSTPGISIQYEQGIWEAGGPGVVSLGGYVGFKNFGHESSFLGFTSSSKWNYTIVGARSAYHYSGLANDKADLYGGVMLSYNILNYSYTDSDGTNMKTGSGSSSVGFTLYVGGRYYFAERLAGFAELGYGISYLNLGLAFKM